MHFGIKLLIWIREYLIWNHPLPRSCQYLKNHTRSKGATTRAPQVYSSGDKKNHSAMDQEIEVEINLTSEQFLIPETFCCVHNNDQKATTMKMKMLEARKCMYLYGSILWLRSIEYPKMSVTHFGQYQSKLNYRIR
jgi:hypothetical protein